MSDMKLIMLRAYRERQVIPAFNIPYLPMMEPVIKALTDTRSFGLIEVARLEWEKFEAKSMTSIREMYEKHKNEKYTRLHLDHVPIIDEDRKTVDYLSIIREGIVLGYDSVMVDGSRLSLKDNIEATRKVVELACSKNIPVEGELGAVLGHEEGRVPPYKTLFFSRQGFTDIFEATRFFQETDVDWLSVAFGNIHGAISSSAKDEKKIEARLDIKHLKSLQKALPIPMVLHGGSGIRQIYIARAVRNGITKINIGTTIRQIYEKYADNSIIKGCQAVYNEVCRIVRDELKIAGMAGRVAGNSHTV